MTLLADLSTDAPRRSLWCRERSSQWWEEIVMGTWNDGDWLENFRMTKLAFQYLCNTLRLKVKKEDTNMRRAISVEKRVAITLWRLGSNSDFRTIGHLFGVAKCTACVITIEICRIIVDVLMPLHVFIPDQKGLKDIMSGFLDRWGFPQCWGAIDGTHFPIKAPEICPKDYYNRKGWFSVQMQGLVDFRYKFLNVCIGWPGSVHDARVFANSNLYALCDNDPDVHKHLNLDINGCKIPPVILGDSAYPLLPWAMKPYVDNGNLTRPQKHFNYRLSRARVVTENAYGRLKGRWRILLKRNDTEFKNLNVVISACVTLHNICESFNEAYNPKWDNKTVDETKAQPSHVPCPRKEQRAEVIRDTLKIYVNDNPL